CFVDAWRLAGRADEKARKEIGQRRVPLKIENQALQKVRTAQERAVGCSLSAQHNMVAPAGSGVAAVDHELVRAEAAQASFLVERTCHINGLAPRRRGMNVDFDN